MFSWQHCPLFQRKLSWIMRILYSSGVWSYIVGAISTPTFIVIPCVTIWFGVFPIVVSQWAALGVTVYYLATNMVSPHSSAGPCTAHPPLAGPYQCSCNPASLPVLSANGWQGPHDVW